MDSIKTEPREPDTESKHIPNDEHQEARMDDQPSAEESMKTVVDCLEGLEYKPCFCERVKMWTSPGATLICGASCAATCQTGNLFYKTNPGQNNMLAAAMKGPTRGAEITYVENPNGLNKIVAIKPLESGQANPTGL